MSALGFRTVTHDEFWAFVRGTERNVHPRSGRMVTEWIDLRTHQVIALVTPGYLCEGEESYQIKEGVQ